MASFGCDWDIQYHPDDDQEKIRTVGVEFECTITNKDCPLYGEDGDNVEDDEYDLRYDIDKYTQDNYNIYIPGIGADGSEFEFVTEPDSITYYLQGGSERFKNFVRFLQENGEPQISDGTHIHISKLKTDDETTFNHLKWLVSNYGMQLQKIFGRVSHWAQTPAQIWFDEKFQNSRPTDEIEHIILPKDYDKITKQYVANKQGMVINRRTTYEFRGGKGSNNIEEILAWIQMVNNIVTLATKEKQEIEETPFKALITGNYIEAYIEKIKENEYRQFIPEELEQTIKTNNFIQAVTISNGRSLL